MNTYYYYKKIPCVLTTKDITKKDNNYYNIQKILKLTNLDYFIQKESKCSCITCEYMKKEKNPPEPQKPQPPQEPQKPLVGYIRWRLDNREMLNKKFKNKGEVNSMFNIRFWGKEQVDEMLYKKWSKLSFKEQKKYNKMEEMKVYWEEMKVYGEEMKVYKKKMIEYKINYEHCDSSRINKLKVLEQINYRGIMFFSGINYDTGSFLDNLEYSL